MVMGLSRGVDWRRAAWRIQLPSGPPVGRAVASWGS